MILSLYEKEKISKRPIEAHRPTISKEELESVLDCLIQDKLGPGKIVQKFEKLFETTFQIKHALSVNSLSSAYHLAFLSLGLNSDDLILMSPLAPVQAYDAAKYVGANIDLIDVGKNSFHPENSDIQKKIDKIIERDGTPPAIFVLDNAFGSYQEFDKSIFQDIKLKDNIKKNIKIVEDITGIVGCSIDTTEDTLELGKDKPSAANKQIDPDSNDLTKYRGDVLVCGLSPQDLFTTVGGAIVATQNQSLYRALSESRYGNKRKPNSVAYDYRLSDFQAAMGLDQLTKIGIMINRRKKIAKKYLDAIKRTEHKTYFSNPKKDGYLKFPVIVSKTSDEVKHYYNSLQIGIEKITDIPIHHLLDLPRMKFPNAERIYRKGACIPIYPALSSNNVERISASLRGLI